MVQITTLSPQELGQKSVWWGVNRSDYRDKLWAGQEKQHPGVGSGGRSMPQ